MGAGSQKLSFNEECCSRVLTAPLPAARRSKSDLASYWASQLLVTTLKHLDLNQNFLRFEAGCSVDKACQHIMRSNGGGHVPWLMAFAVHTVKSSA